MSEPLAAPYRVGLLDHMYRDRLDSPHRLFMYTAGLTGADIARGYLGNPLRESDEKMLAADDPMAAALAKISLALGTTDWDPAVPSMEELPNPLRVEVARVIFAISSAEQFRRRAFRDLPDGFNVLNAFPQIVRNEYGFFDEPDHRILMEEVEFEALYSGMLDLVAAMEDFDNYFDEAESVPETMWSMQTPLGTISINTMQQADEYHFDRPPLLAVDTHGDDVWKLDYKSVEPRGWISIIYDRAGNDRYESGRVCGTGAGMFGYGIHWDVAGDDVYQESAFAQGSALFGAALFIDEAGDDRYHADAYSQSFAVAGASLFIDGGGNDRYRSLISSQASAEARAAAVLIDVAGDDDYLLDKEPLVKPSAQSPEHNTSMGQGAATGVRASLTDGRSLPGGVALLLDLDGNDRYRGGLFVQGAGYLEGTGLLVDGGGNDSYEAVWYAQGAGAHSAFGGLLDRGDGDDSYYLELFTGIATAHDFSAAFLLDEGGNDTYTARGLAICSANENGTALFVDVSGDDHYILKERSGLGAARMDRWGSARESSLNAALFFDLGGTDTYETGRAGVGNNAQWLWPREYPDLELPSESGIGIDGEYESPFHTGPRTDKNDYDDGLLKQALEARRAYRARAAAK